jgi:hypothetical protein
MKWFARIASNSIDDNGLTACHILAAIPEESRVRVKEASMKTSFGSWLLRSAAAALVVGAVAVPLAPTPAHAEWHHGWGWHGGWGWHHGWGWRGCCWGGPGVVVGVAPPPVVVGPPAVYAPPPVYAAPAYPPPPPPGYYAPPPY